MNMIFILIMSLGFAAPAEEATSVKDCFKEGKLILDVRLRAESVDQSSEPSLDALATTLRTRLGFQTATYKKTYLYLDFENITALDDDAYNSTTNGVTDKAVVADPETTEVNQVYLNIKAGKNNFRLGRQRIILDNARFVGNVGWRQNEQTFDAFLWQNKAVKNTTFTAGYLHGVNRIFGDDHPAGDFELNSFVLHARIAKTPVGNLSVFGYFLDNEDAPAGSHKDLGFRLDGKYKINDRYGWGYDVSYADQSPYKDGADRFDNDYLSLAIGPNWGKYKLRLGYEALGGNGEAGFVTPFATLHAFNGWADKFLGTPGAGLTDTFLNFTWANNGWKCVVVYHDFESDQGSIAYGSEIDALLAKKLNKQASVGLKLADYSADEHSVDTTKIWAFSQMKW